MKCSKCGQEKTRGKVEGGVFVCTPCINAEKVQSGELITFYLVDRSFSPPEAPKILKAIYKETKDYFVLQERDSGWPHYDVKVHKTGWVTGQPGHRTPQEAVDAELRNRRMNLGTQQREMERARLTLEILEDWAVKAGFHIAPPPPPNPTMEEDLV
jgi:hypothetical protein